MKQLLYKVSIKNKVISVVVLTVSIVVASVFVFLSLKELRSLESNSIKNTNAVAEMLSNLSDYALEFNQKYNAEEAIKPLKSYSNIIAGQIITANDSIFITYNTRNDVIVHKQIPTESYSYVDAEYIHVYKPVVKDNKRLGTVYIRADIANLLLQKEDYFKTIFFLFIIVLCVSYLIALLLQHHVSDPIRKLVRVTNEVSLNGNYNIELEPKFNDEVGQLYTSFSGMMQTINIRESERDDALFKLEQSQATFKNITESAFDAIILTDSEARIIYWNNAAERIFGYKSEQVLNYSIATLIPKRFQSHFNDSFKRFQQKRYWRFIGIPFNFKAQRNDTTEFPIELTINQIGVGAELNLSFTIKDISQRKEYEESLIVARRKAEESDKLKSAFLANMSHEIRTPMNSIIGFSELLLKPNIGTSEREKFLNFIVTSGKSLLNLINDIIDISKIEAGQLKISKTNTDVNALLSELFATFYENPKVNRKFELVLKRAFTNQKFMLLTDPYRLRQIMINLLTNAFKFTDEGFVEFGYKIINTNEVVFYVKDTGVGIPEDKQGIIFDRFGQIEDTYFKNKGGTGLGLGISKKLAELLSGRIWLESSLGNGATFLFALPYTTESGLRKLPPKERKELTQGNWKDKTVLIAEDEDSNFMFLQELLKTTEINILHAYNGIEALDIFQENPDIDIVLMDIKMPEMDGYEATRLLKAEQPKLPIIAQTAYAMADEEQKSYEAGCDGYITKPINFTQLLNMMEDLLDKK